MIVSVLGMAVGVNAKAVTPSYLIDTSTLLSCGSGIEALAVDSLLAIEHVLLPHSQRDHCCGLPSLVSCHAQQGGRGITVHTQQETINELKAGLFAESAHQALLTAQSAQGSPLLRFDAIEVGDAIPLSDGMATALPAQSDIAAVGWIIEGPWRALAYTGDSDLCPAFWHWVANTPSLTDIICSITDPARHPSEGRMTPSALLTMLEVIPPNVQIWIYPQQEGGNDTLIAELKRNVPSNMHITALNANTAIDL